MNWIREYLWIGFGSALGGMLRHACSAYIAQHTTQSFPWGTLFVNGTGSFLIGILAGISAPYPIQLFLVIGFCGGYTTFSSFSLQTLHLLQKGQLAQALGNVFASVFICMLSVALGYSLTRK